MIHHTHRPALFLKHPSEVCALLGALVLIALHALAGPQVQALLEYRADQLWAQPWRMATAHGVHWTWTHVLINALAWVAVAGLFFRELSVWRQVVTALVAAIAIGLALPVLAPELHTYRGFSGVLHALYFAGAVLWLMRSYLAREQMILPALLLAGGVIKLLLEAPWSAVLPWVNWLGASVVPPAHDVGALVGALLGAGFAWVDWKQRSTG